VNNRFLREIVEAGIRVVGLQGNLISRGESACSSHLLEVEDLRCGYGNNKPIEIVHGVTFFIDRDEFVCIIGANGCGKTTTLKAIMGLLPTISGQVRIAGCDIALMTESERARYFAYIPQAHTPPFPFKVSDVVLMGRTPYINRLSQVTENDRVIAYRALELLDICDLADSVYTKLSGGQQQLVLIARALTQQSDILIMDEPTASLDFGNQQLVLSRMRMLARMGKAVIMVTHDPDHALFCADRVIVMDKGVVLAEGTTDDCITTEMLHLIYNTDAHVMNIEVEPGRYERICVPLSH
jgi:iron complex transport system ATP-binding protein